MKALTISFLIMFTAAANAVCLVPISRDNINPGQVPTSAAYNSDFDNLYARANTVPGNCLLDLSLREDQIADGALGTSHFADASVTAIKLASGALPAFGKLLRVKSLTGSGSWTKQNDVGFVVVHVIGGGGGISTAGGSSSFGAHCTAGGGSNSSTGAGGTASSGSINLSGGDGEKQTFNSSVACFVGSGTTQYCPFRGAGGKAYAGHYGQGGSTFVPPSSGSTRLGAGGGGYCMKIIQADLLNSPETVTVGTGGSGPANSNPGKSGLVLIYEYGR